MTPTTLAEALRLGIHESWPEDVPHVPGCADVQNGALAALLALPSDRRAALAAELLDVETLAAAFGQHKWRWLAWTDHETVYDHERRRREEALQDAATALLAALRSPT